MEDTYRPDLTGPRCRLCGAPLPSRGWRRNCGSCGSVHIYLLYGLGRNALVGAVGGFFLLVAAALVLAALFFSRSIDRETAMARQGSLRSAAELAGASGSVLVEGRVSASNPLLHQQLVAYTREVEEPSFNSKGRRRSTWRRDGEQRPALLIELSDGSVRLTDGYYVIDGRLHVLSAKEQGVSRRYTGLQAGDPVLVFGRVVLDNGEPRLSSSKVFAGSRTEFVADARGDRSGLAFCGSIFLGLWTALGFFLVFMLWRNAEALGLHVRR